MPCSNQRKVLIETANIDFSETINTSMWHLESVNISFGTFSKCLLQAVKLSESISNIFDPNKPL